MVGGTLGTTSRILKMRHEVRGQSVEDMLELEVADLWRGQRADQRDVELVLYAVLEDKERSERRAEAVTGDHGGTVAASAALGKFVTTPRSVSRRSASCSS